MYIVIGHNPHLGHEYGKCDDEGVILGIFDNVGEAQRLASRHEDVATIYVSDPLTYKFKDGGKRLDIHGFVKGVKR